MAELITSGTPNIVCIQPFACLPNHVVGKGVIKALRAAYPGANIVAVDYDPGASEVNQLNRIKLMLTAAQRALHALRTHGPVLEAHLLHAARRRGDLQEAARDDPQRQRQQRRREFSDLHFIPSFTAPALSSTPEEWFLHR